MRLGDALKWIRGKVEGMNERESAAARDRLVQAVAEARGARATILIRDFDELCASIMDVLKAAGMTSEQAANMLRDSIRAVCPTCGWLSTGKELMGLWLMGAMGFERMGPAAGPGAVSRLARGVCPSGRCLSRLITVVWEPSLIASAEEDREPPPA
ncbi:MAG: hypothetical protein N2512_04365 [Armatimonadetes bacterium]|nr:hypothetical protein [Armatimonadota bacterium]